MKATLSGTHCTGKTTLLRALKDSGFSPEVKFLDSPTRELKEKGFKINDDQDNYDVTQILCITRDVENFYLNENFISDRGALDTLIYTMYLYDKGKVSEKCMKLVRDLAITIIPNYTHFFYIPPEISLVGDSVRSEDVEFREEIDEMFNRVFDGWRLDRNLFSNKVFCVSGTIEKRVNKIKDYVNR